jgi:hypothetical protein
MAKIPDIILNPRKVWQESGMQFKCKALVGLYQCVGAVPSVFDVILPPGVSKYSRWINLLEVPSELTNLIIPGACLGSYRRCVCSHYVFAPQPHGSPTLTRPDRFFDADAW